MPTNDQERVAPTHWLNRTTLGVGLTSLLSDWSHEIATAILPALLMSLGAGPGWLGVIEGVADGLSSITKLVAGHFTDRLRSRKPLVVTAYAITAAATGAIGFAGTAIHVLLARSTAWLARGVRTPARKALLAAAVPPEAYGRAFGFERMMDTIGAVVAPLTALWLLLVTSHNYRHVLLWTLVPGFAAATCFGLLVRERRTGIRAKKTFVAGLRDLPREFRLFLVAVGVFGLGDFSHTLLILYATQKLTPGLGAAMAASTAIGLYLLRNIFYAGFAYVGGWLGDQAPRRKFVLAGGYAVALGMALLLATNQSQLAVLMIVFALAGIFTGVEEALEDSITAEIVPATQHGMAYGTLAAVNAVGDFTSSVVIGALWTAASPSAAFTAAGILFAAATILILRLREP
ncbi:MAG: MFS transporter [Acidobacteriia bacterium]|nr:MFS transporter [Terriglobia bacterium]